MLQLYILYPLKILENQQFSDVFREFHNGIFNGMDLITFKNGRLIKKL